MTTFQDRLAFSAEEVAELMGVGAQTVREKCRDGSIRTIDGFGRRHLIPRSEVERLTGERLGLADTVAVVESRREQRQKVRTLRQTADGLAQQLADLRRQIAALDEGADGQD